MADTKAEEIRRRDWQLARKHERDQRTARERLREDALYRQAQRVYDEEDRSPDSNDEPERPEW